MSDQKQSIYLDYAAATPLWPTVVEVMTKSMALHGNPGSLHADGYQMRQTWNQAIDRIARLLGCQSDEIVITSGATESSNLAILGSIPSTDIANSHIITSTIEHPASYEPIKHLETLGAHVTWLPVNNCGQIDIKQLSESITSKTQLISLIAAHNETGVIQPIHRIVEMIRRAEKTFATKILIHLDTSQWAAWQQLNPHHLDVDLLTISGAKIGGPAGLLYVKRGTILQPILYGGGQQHSLRPGTEDVIGAVGLAAAIETTWQQLPVAATRIRALRDQIADAIIDAFPIAIRRDQKEGLPNILHLTIPGLDAESAIYALSEAGIAIASGSACSTNQPEQKQRILAALGIPVADRASTLRISLGWTTSVEDISRALPVMIGILKQVHEQSAKLTTLQQAGKQLSKKYAEDNR
jgi:cysteine desulfurase